MGDHNGLKNCPAPQATKDSIRSKIHTREVLFKPTWKQNTRKVKRSFLGVGEAGGENIGGKW